jgi:hypothetical protein
MAETMVTGFKRLPQRAYLGGYTSCFGSRTHFQLATFYALNETPEIQAVELLGVCTALLLPVPASPLVKAALPCAPDTNSIQSSE